MSEQTKVKIDAQIVKRLRQETGAPMMECKKALVEAEGDFDRAKQILREKGQAQAAKRAGRATSEGIAAVVASEDSTKVACIVVECETDFVARNADFKTMVGELADGLLASVEAGAGETVEPDLSTVINGMSLQQHAEEAVAKIRENIRIVSAVVAKAADGGKIAVYNHTNTGKAASYIEYTGDDAKAAFQVAIQTVAFPPTFLRKEDVPQNLIDEEIKTETQRAINEGKPADIAGKIAQGRVNKEFFQSRVLLEQPLWTDAKKKVSDYAKAAGIEIVGYRHFAVGAGPSDG
ncbi:MAG: translation elongation factor Ts [Armatimonadetes bacterium]|nr:translation elongation factor Ts [Armatimonadota bacterium]